MFKRKKHKDDYIDRAWKAAIRSMQCDCDDLKHRTVQLGSGSCTAETPQQGEPQTASQEPPSPIAELCRDIIEHPWEYRLDQGKIVHRKDSRLIADVGLTLDSESAIFEEAWEAVGEVMDREIEGEVTARLAAVKAARPATIKRPTWTIEAPVERTVTAYMCAIDWDHELGEASDGTWLYRRQADLPAEHRKCGVVEVEVRLRRRVEPVTVETHTPGDTRPAMRDFLTDPGPAPKPAKRKKKKAGAP